SFSQPAAYSLYYNGYLYENMSVTGWKFSQKNGEPEWEFTLEGSPGATSAEPEWQESGRCLIVPRGRQTPQGAGGTRVTRAGAVVSDWYSVNVEVSGLSKAGYYGYASTPSFTGCPKLQGAFSIGVDADPSNVGSFFGTQTEAWTVSNTTDGASFSIGFSAVCLESRGYADEQQLVKSYTGSFAIVENAGGIITAAVDTGE
ncbi:MAG: hypothetical protein IK083_07975, partial [Abditibacteriota bacterium]|nr:hypothetical protein [Abditibacteriota bacterium]